jgi:hypothetical protein
LFRSTEILGGKKKILPINTLNVNQGMISLDIVELTVFVFKELMFMIFIS